MAPLCAPHAGMRTNVINNHKAKQNLYHLDEDDDFVAPIPCKQIKFASPGSFLHHTVGLQSPKLSMSKALSPKWFRVMYTQLLLSPPLFK